MGSLIRLRFFASTVVVTGCLILTGCTTPEINRPEDNSHMAQRHGFWQPYLLYLLPSPHSRLYVEVDAVEGCEPSDATLNKLREFLTTYCKKPGGIEIVRSEVIPIQDAQGIQRKALAYKFFEGPPQRATDPPPAFIYVLFYDGALCDQPAASGTGQPAAPTRTSDLERDMVPHVELLPYPAIIFMNTRYASPLVRDDVLLHEAGHLLGLARRATGAATNHCLDATCRMKDTIYMQYSRLLSWRDPIKQHGLCERCVAELAASSTAPPPTNLHFVGPVLVRSEAGYHVLSLPSRVTLIVGDLSDQDCRDFAAAVRTETPPPGIAKFRADGWIKEEVLREPAKMRNLINRAKADLFEPVRTAAFRMESMVKRVSNE